MAATAKTKRGRALVLGTILLAAGAPAAAIQEPEPPPIRALRTGGLKAEQAAIIMSGQEGGNVPVEVLVLPIEPAGDKIRVPLILEVEGDALVAGQEEGQPLRIELYAYALGDGGSLQDSLMQTFEVDLDRIETPVARTGVKFRGELEVRPGSYSLRILVRNVHTGRVGIRVLPLVATPPGSEPRLLPPLIAEPEGAWLTLREVRERSAPARPPIPPLDRLPAARPLLAIGAEVPLRLVAFDLGAVGSELAVEIRNRAGERLELPAKVTGYGPPTPAGYRILDATFRVEHLLPGDYTLYAVLGGDVPLESPPVPVRVVPEAQAEAALVWAAIRPERAAAVAEADVLAAARSTVGHRGGRKIKKGPLEDGYAAVLSTLANGGVAEARTDLYRLSDKVRREQGAAGLTVLERVQLDLAGELADRDPEALAPILMLHHWLYREARHRKVHLLSTHARNTTIKLVDLSLAKNATDEGRQRAARVLASLGGEIQSSGLTGFSQRLFRRVVSIDSGNETALLAMAVNYERFGEYGEAIYYLEQLVEAHPENGQGRLRLAIDLLREGKPKASRRHLRKIIEGKHHSDWVLSLAYQELARLYLDGNRLQEAEKVLNEAIERLPGDEKLYIQLAFVYDARQEPWNSLRTLDRMGTRVGRAGGESARHRFTHWPSENLGETRRALRAEAEGQIPRLRGALETFGGGR
jgi:tetratricopeptide (TPR) repeat protein